MKRRRYLFIVTLCILVLATSCSSQNRETSPSLASKAFEKVNDRGNETKTDKVEEEAVQELGSKKEGAALELGSNKDEDSTQEIKVEEKITEKKKKDGNLGQKPKEVNKKPENKKSEPTKMEEKESPTNGESRSKQKAEKDKVTSGERAKKEPIITKKNIVEKKVIAFKTIDRYESTGAKSRVQVEGKNGSVSTTIQVTYQDGKEKSRQVISTKTTRPVDKVIARYINTPKTVTKTVELEDKNKPIYEYEDIDRWFALWSDDEGNVVRTEYFYSYDEILDLVDRSLGLHMENGKEIHIGRYGTADPEVKKKLVGYEKVTKTIEEKVDNFSWKY